MISNLTTRRKIAVLSCGLLVGAAACGDDDGSSTASRSTSPPTIATTEPGEGGEDGGDELDVRAAAREEADAGAVPGSPAGIYEGTLGGLDPAVEDHPRRAYVPNSGAGTVSVIDTETYEIIAEHEVGVKPHHITPSWDMQTLYALDTAGDMLIPFDPLTSEPGEPIPVEDPYNLYFAPDGEMAIVVAERFSRLDLRDPETWELIAEVPIPHSGVNHGDFSADGRYFYASTEWSGWVVKVDLEEHRVVEENQVGVEAIDVKMSPDGEVLFVADQNRNGVIVLDAGDLSELEFIPTEGGTHGLYFSRDATRLFASNRLGGSVSVIDVASRTVTDTWTIPDGGSPDMGGLSIDGSELWLSGRYNAEAYVIDTETGELKHRIPTADGSHGLAIWPQPGNYSTGHTGVMR